MLTHCSFLFQTAPYLDGILTDMQPKTHSYSLFVLFKPLNTSSEHLRCRDLSRGGVDEHVRTQNPKGEKGRGGEKKSKRPAIKNTTVSEKWEGWPNSTRIWMGISGVRTEGRETVGQTDSEGERGSENEWFGLEAGAQSQGWQGFWWRSVVVQKSSSARRQCVRRGPWPWAASPPRAMATSLPPPPSPPAPPPIQPKTHWQAALRWSCCCCCCMFI